MAGGTRKSRQQVLVDLIKDYNKDEKVRSCKINTDEIAAVRFLSQRDEAFINHLKVLWGADRIGNTAVPMNMPGTQGSVQDVRTSDVRRLMSQRPVARCTAPAPATTTALSEITTSRLEVSEVSGCSEISPTAMSLAFGVRSLSGSWNCRFS
jgi:hypothetical protein